MNLLKWCEFEPKTKIGLRQDKLCVDSDLLNLFDISPLKYGQLRQIEQFHTINAEKVRTTK